MKRWLHPGTRRLSLIWLALVVLSVESLVGVSLPPPQAARPSSDIQVRFHKGLLSLEVEQANLGQVLAAIAERVGMEIVIRGDLDPTPGDWSMMDQPLLEAIRKLVGEHDMLLAYSGSGTRGLSGSKTRLWIYGPRTELSLSQPGLSIERNLTDEAAPKEQSEVARLARVLTEDPEPSNRSHAAVLLEERGGEEAAAVLEQGLGDKAPTVRSQVVRSLVELQAERAIPALGRILLSDASPQVRLTAVEALGRQQTGPVRTFLEIASRDRDTKVRGRALELLAQIPVEAP